MVGARDRARHVLRAHGLVDPDGVLAREAVQLAREERLGGEVAPVLLADDDDERRAVDARGGERADGVAEPGGRVQDRERGLAAPDRPAGRHADDRALVQREHEAEVVRQIGQQLDLGRARVREDRGQPVLAPDVEGRLADGLRGHAHADTAYVTNHLIFVRCRCDDGRREGDDRRRSRRRRRVDGLQPRADARPARGRDRRQPARDDHVARDGPRAGARAVARLQACAAATWAICRDADVVVLLSSTPLVADTSRLEYLAKNAADRRRASPTRSPPAGAAWSSSSRTRSIRS